MSTAEKRQPKDHHHLSFVFPPTPRPLLSSTLLSSPLLPPSDPPDGTPPSPPSPSSRPLPRPFDPSDALPVPSFPLQGQRIEFRRNQRNDPAPHCHGLMSPAPPSRRVPDAAVTARRRSPSSLPAALLKIQSSEHPATAHAPARAHGRPRSCGRIDWGCSTESVFFGIR